MADFAELLAATGSALDTTRADYTGRTRRAHQGAAALVCPAERSSFSGRGCLQPESSTTCTSEIVRVGSWREPNPAKKIGQQLSIEWATSRAFAWGLNGNQISRACAPAYAHRCDCEQFWTGKSVCSWVPDPHHSAVPPSRGAAGFCHR